jgi:uncharacterized phage protein (TIGR02218 family)
MDQFYIYKFTDRDRDYLYTGVGHPLEYDGIYAPIGISHSPPTFSSDPSQARVTVKLRDDLIVAMNYISHPPPSKTELRIWEVLETVPSIGNSLLVTRVEPHWAGQIVRVAWRDGFRVADILCRTAHEIHFSRETNNESLNPLCRFHLGDGRCPVNIEDFKEQATVTNISDDISEPTVTVSGLSQADSYYAGGMVRTADFDWRTVLQSVGGVLTLSRAFPSTSIQDGDTVDVFAGDDLTFETCSVKFGAATNSGEAWGGWKLTPNRDYQKDGIR